MEKDRDLVGGVDINGLNWKLKGDRDLVGGVDINGLNWKFKGVVQRSEIGGQPRCFGWDIEQYYRYNGKNQQKNIKV